MKASLLFLFILAMVSCSPELPDGDMLIKEIYDERVADYVAQQIVDCKADAIADAEEHVDSIVHGMLNANLVDSLEFPNRPVKPVRPQPIIGKVSKFEVEGE